MLQVCTQNTLNPLDKGIITAFRDIFNFCKFKILFIKLTFQLLKFKFNKTNYTFHKKQQKLINF